MNYTELKNRREMGRRSGLSGFQTLKARDAKDYPEMQARIWEFKMIRRTRHLRGSSFHPLTAAIKSKWKRSTFGGESIYRLSLLNRSLLNNMEVESTERMNFPRADDPDGEQLKRIGYMTQRGLILVTTYRVDAQINAMMHFHKV